MGLKRDIMIGLGMLAIALLIITALVGVVLLVQKAFGLLLVIFGLFILIWFPDVMGATEYQPEFITKKGIYLGLVLLVAGLILLVL